MPPLTVVTPVLVLTPPTSVSVPPLLFGQAGVAADEVSSAGSDGVIRVGVIHRDGGGLNHARNRHAFIAVSVSSNKTGPPLMNVTGPPF